ncbi:hypothetical protein ANN_18979 [Periplaneta americana]|uniref:Uncharacterized protein n=1 Tax=Periplaneta americana TaxID=6978 RepID=A0ABQ8SQ77_PERAM|nr:hypothetical protein ANN_18979 [Periplaneta americana]
MAGLCEGGNEPPGSLKAICFEQATPLVPRPAPSVRRQAAFEECYGDGTTPLILAAASGHVDCVKELLDQGADPRARRVDERRKMAKDYSGMVTSGKEERARPRKTWKAGVMQMIKDRHMQEEDWRDREGWRKGIQGNR